MKDKGNIIGRAIQNEMEAYEFYKISSNIKNM